MGAYIKNLNEIGKIDFSLVGGKAANLGELLKGGFPVPAGFCVTAEAFDWYLQENQIDIHKVCPEDLRKGRMPAQLAREIISAYDTFVGQDKKVSVRSSATAEDLPEASFAGQHESYLSIQKDDVIEYVKKCWASLWTDRSLDYRRQQGFVGENVKLAVVVQEMVPSQVSGVAFSVNPITHNPEEICIDGAWGLGEGIVSGMLTPDSFIVRKQDGTLIQQTIGDKQIQILSSPNRFGTQTLETPDEQKGIPCLSEEKLKELASIVARIEAYYGFPQDIEWALVHDQMFILQARPITTIDIHQPEFFNWDEETEWTNLNGLKERYNEPLSVLGWSLIDPCQTVGMRWTLESLSGQRVPKDMKMFANFYGYVYMNFTAFKKSLPKSVLAPFFLEEREGVSPVERGGMQDSVMGVRTLLGGLKLARTLDKGFYEKIPSFIEQMNVYKGQKIDEFSNEELLAHLHEIHEMAKEYFQYQVASLGVAENLFKIFSNFMKKNVDDIDLSLTAKLVSGLPGNLTVEMNNDVWKVAQSSLSIEEFLEKHGHQNVNMDIANEFWEENPSLVLSMVQGFKNTEEINPMEREKEKQKEREETEKKVRARLKLLQRIIFDKLLPQVQGYMLLRDNRHYYVTLPFYMMKKGIRLLANRLVQAGLLKKEDDIYCLQLQEIEGYLHGDIGKQEITHFIMLRKRGKKVQLDQLPSLFKGTPQVKEVSLKLSGEGIFKGLSGSPGRVTGKVKVIRSTEDFAQLQAGEILVAMTTNPAWTPLFSIAGALVTDYGGPLSHGAIVAREYGIPAVLGIKNATNLFKNGQKITVDGNQGIVILEE